MLKTLKHIYIKHIFYLILAFSATQIFVGCGKRQPPLPPVEKSRQTVVINGFQRGNLIMLSWKLPARNAGSSSVLNIDRLDIYRLAEPLSAPLSLSEEEFSSRSTLIHTRQIGQGDFGLTEQTYSDRLSLAGQPVRLRYAVRLANASGQKASFSNFLLISPSGKVALPPTGLRLELTPDKIDLTWKAPSSNIDEGSPANILGYNLYRISSETKEVRKLNSAPITERKFEDLFFEFEKSYNYFLRTVSLGPDAEPLESLDSDRVEITPKDQFPPSPPASLTIAAAPGQISIFFASNLEKDVVGYQIFRSEDRNVPLDGWKLLTPAPFTTNTFQDTTVVSGKTFFYYLKAVDKFGNISRESAIISETVP